MCTRCLSVSAGDKRLWQTQVCGSVDKLSEYFRTTEKQLTDCQYMFIIFYSAMIMTQTVEYAQYATGGRLGVR